MSISITPINTATDTFATWVTQTNTIIDVLSSNTVTVDATTTGSATTGNAALTGDLSVSGNLVVTNLRGGSLTTAGAFTITTNVTASANLTVSGNMLTVSGAGGLDVTTGGATISGTITQTDGLFVINRIGDAADSLLITDTDAGQAGYVYYRVGGINRWAVGRQASGNNFQVVRYNTSGVFQESTILIDDGTGLTTLANGLTVTTGVTTLNANLDMGAFGNRVILDTDNDTALYASADDNVILQVGNATRLNVNTTVADFQATIVRTGGDIIVDTDTGDLRLGIGTSNVVANSSTIRLADATGTFDITKPTADQITANNYYLASDGTWKIAGADRATDTITGVSTAGEIANFLMVDFRTAEVTVSVRHTSVNAYYASKMLVLHDDETNADATYNEYSALNTNTTIGVMGSLSANANATHVRVFWTNSANTAEAVVRSSISYLADV